MCGAFTANYFDLYDPWNRSPSVIPTRSLSEVFPTQLYLYDCLLTSSGASRPACKHIRPSGIYFWSSLHFMFHYPRWNCSLKWESINGTATGYHRHSVSPSSPPREGGTALAGQAGMDAVPWRLAFINKVPCSGVPTRHHGGQSWCPRAAGWWQEE